MSYNYVDDCPNSNLTCCICRVPFVNPVTTKTCAHTFCCECIERALQHSSHCPIDRSPLTQDDLFPADPIVRSLVDELIVECSNRSLGCTQTLQRQLLESHLKDSCQYTEITCEEAECQEVLLRKDTRRHVNNCPHRVITCDGCQADVKFMELESHLSECPATTASCPSCSLDMPRSELQAHTSTCPDVVIPCAHSASGCPWAGPRYSSEAHLLSCPYEAIKGFFAINNDRMSNLSTENAVLRQRVDSLEGQIRNMKRDLLAVVTALGPWYRHDGFYVPPILMANLPFDVQPILASTSTSRPNADLEPSPSFLPVNNSGLSTTPPVADPFAPFFPIQDRDLGPGSPPEPQFTNRRNTHRPLSSVAEVNRPAQTSVAPINLSSTIEGAFEGLRESLVTIASSVDSLARRNEIALTNETLRLNEEIMSLRANIHGLRIQVHTIMMDRNAQVTGRSNDFAPAVGDAWQPPAPRVHFPPPLGHGSITKL